MPTKKFSQFHVKLDGIKLPSEAEKRIEKGIQSLVLQELASHMPTPDGPDNPGRVPHGGVIVVPIPWPGYWLRMLDNVEIGTIGKSINVNFNEVMKGEMVG